MSTSLKHQILATLKRHLNDHMAAIPEEDGLNEFDVTHWGKQFADLLVSLFYLVMLTHRHRLQDKYQEKRVAADATIDETVSEHITRVRAMLDKDLPGRWDWLDWAGVELMPETAQLNKEEKAKADIERATSIALQQEATMRRTKEIETRMEGLSQGWQAAIDLHLDGALDADALDKQIGQIKDEETALKAELAKYTNTPATTSTSMTIDDGPLPMEDEDVLMSGKELEVAKSMKEIRKTPSAPPLASSKRKEREEEPGCRVNDPKVCRCWPICLSMRLTPFLVRPLQESEVRPDLRGRRRRPEVSLMPRYVEGLLVQQGASSG
jgi:hypothetical protein